MQGKLVQHKRVINKITPVQPAKKTLLPFTLLAQKKWIQFLVLWLTPLLIMQSFLSLSLTNNKNYLEVFPEELLLPTTINVLLSLLIAAIVYFMKQPSQIGPRIIVSVILGLTMVGYDARMQYFVDIFRSLVPVLPKPGSDIALISLLFILLLVFLARAIGIILEKAQHKYERLDNKSIVGAVVIVVVVIAGGQLVQSARVLPTIIQQSTTQAAPLTSQAKNNHVLERPDIFYIVLDRYTNSQVLKEQFGYDNSSFTNYLNENDFLVNDSAYSNYPYTTMSISSTLNAQYTNNLVAPFRNNEIQARTLYHNTIRQSSVIKELKKNNYKYYAIGSWSGASNKNPLAEKDLVSNHKLHLFGYEKNLLGLEASEFLKSPFYRFSQINAFSNFFQLQSKTEVNDVRSQISQLKYLAESQPDSRFVFAHILVPHDPFYFNGDGSLSQNPSNDSVGRPIKEKYISQVDFINNQMKEIISKIKQRSAGKSIILLSADEGPYPNVLNATPLEPEPRNPSGDVIPVNNMTMWPLDWLEMKYGILQAVYIPEASPQDLSKLSSVNLFRIVLNTALGYSLPYLPQCHYGLLFDGFKEYNYADISDKLGITKDTACKQFESLPTN